MPPPCTQARLHPTPRLSLSPCPSPPPPALQDRPLRQHMCNLDASACDKALGPRTCLALRNARNTATLVAVLAGLAAAAATTAAAAVILASRARQHASRQRGWQRVDSKEKAEPAV